LKDTSNIYQTIKEVKMVNGYFGYVFVIEDINHFVYGETKEEAFNFVADYIKEYYGETNDKRETNFREKKVRKSKKEL
jgi:hypothetical protein